MAIKSNETIMLAVTPAKFTNYGIVLVPAVQCASGKKAFLRMYCSGEISVEGYIESYCDDHTQFVETAEDLLTVLNQYKPEGDCVLLTHDRCAYWVPVNEKGQIRTYREKPFSGSQEKVMVELPNDGSFVRDGNGQYYGSTWCATVNWNALNGATAVINHMNAIIEKVRASARVLEEQDRKERAHGATVLAKLRAAQEACRPITDRIADKWNSMSVDEKAKLLKITKSPKKTTKGTAKKTK